MTFLEKGYKMPKQKSNYLKLEEGNHTFRVLSSAIVGWEAWIDTEDGGRKPLRAKSQDDLPEVAFEQREIPKHFWAFVIYNREEEQIQILEITQRSIMMKMEALVRNEKWGDPKEYDICITRTGKTMQDTNYSTMPEPKEKLDPAILKLYKDMDIKLDKLYSGGDPFSGDESLADEADKAIN